ncbi:hypothetical protein [Pyxidicoccus sp. MSG2]|uniref:hypothetical protein n=1 Tax=Pyxidicoccus sp. MSG2 TaxID=2996790 RepID=UPI002270AD34|nr:hypothetical protein [Pyxidicoccus sp. MSG2]MCY1022757.1 hypothetical protein [Pyxidicoccus sp. MSG2]
MSHLSQLDLEAHALRALSPAAASHVEAHLASCQPCADALATLQATHRRFESDVLPRTLPRVRERLEARPAARPWTWLLAPAALAVAASLAAVVLLRPSGTVDDSRYGVKGGAVLRVYAKRGDGVSLVKDGVRLSAGDALRFTVVPAGLPYLLVVSVDGAGAVSVYHPAGGTQSAPLPESGNAPVELPGSLVLDAAPGPERIWALFSREPLRRADVEPALRALAARGADAVRASRTLSVAGVAAQDSFLLEKSTP